MSATGDCGMPRSDTSQVKISAAVFLCEGVSDDLTDLCSLDSLVCRGAVSVEMFLHSVTRPDSFTVRGGAEEDGRVSFLLFFFCFIYFFLFLLLLEQTERERDPSPSLFPAEDAALQMLSYHAPSAPHPSLWGKVVESG